ncbi:hypothetical protein [Streptomyces sp. IGB124]|uniref:hypothetical protein n=1 Tax=Streptomyces sp. IGB124 TaxID=1519485 RepID=UPI000A76F4CC|nr:hypothetical protein [Streptomyces sp. IGB124]
MDASAVAAALEEARLDLADELRGPAELAEWERTAALLGAARPGTVYDPDVDDVVQAELAADAAAATARETELREAVRITARANHLQVLRDLDTLDQAEPAEGDEAVRDELTRRAGGYVQPDVDAWLARALAARLGHYADPAAREAATSLLTPPVLAHTALLGELLRLVPGADADELAFALLLPLHLQLLLFAPAEQHRALPLCLFPLPPLLRVQVGGLGVGVLRGRPYSSPRGQRAADGGTPPVRENPPGEHPPQELRGRHPLRARLPVPAGELRQALPDRQCPVAGLHASPGDRPEPRCPHPVAEPHRRHPVLEHPLRARGDVIRRDGGELRLQCRPPGPGRVARQHIGPPRTVRAAHLELGVCSCLSRGCCEFQLQQVVGGRLLGQCTLRGARCMGEEPQATGGEDLRVHRVTAFVTGQRGERADLPHLGPVPPAPQVG